LPFLYASNLCAVYEKNNSVNSGSSLTWSCRQPNENMLPPTFCLGKKLLHIPWLINFFIVDPKKSDLADIQHC